MSPTLILLALAMGAIISIYVPMVSKSSQVMGSVFMGNVPFFAIALLSSVIIAVAAGQRAEAFGKALRLPPELYLPGILSAVMIVGSSYVVPKIGISAFFILMVSGQVLAGLVLGQLGLFGTPQTALTLGKVAGAALVIGGVWLVTYR